MKSWIHTARFSRSKSAEKGSGTSFTIVGITVRNSIFVKSSLSANGFFCFLLITMNSTCERPSSHFSRDGLDGRPSSLARVKLKQRIMDVHIFPQDWKWKKILKYPFIDVPPSSSLQFLPPTSFNCRDWPRSSAGNPISKKRDRILWSLFHIPELGMAEEATSSDHIKPCTLWRKGGGVGKLIFISFRSHWQHGSSEMRSWFLRLWYWNGGRGRDEMQLHCSLDEICDKAPGITVSIFANNLDWKMGWSW